ncbi:hypothetical protein MC885_015015, partial [Smutsia gigantea]
PRPESTERAPTHEVLVTGTGGIQWRRIQAEGARGDGGGSSRNRRTGPFGKKAKAQEVGNQPSDRPQEAPWTDFCDFRDITHVVLKERHVLIMDHLSTCILSSCCKISDILDEGISSETPKVNSLWGPQKAQFLREAAGAVKLLKTNGESPVPAWRPLFAEPHGEGAHRSESVWGGWSVQALMADFLGTPSFIYKATHIFFTDSD